MVVREHKRPKCDPVFGSGFPDLSRSRSGCLPDCSQNVLDSFSSCHCMQLNALLCCLWRKVEASCRKHFVVFSRNQHRRLLPAMCHNLRDGGRPPATAFTTPACCSVNTGSQARCRLRISISVYHTCIRRPC